MTFLVVIVASSFDDPQNGAADPLLVLRKPIYVWGRSQGVIERPGFFTGTSVLPTTSGVSMANQDGTTYFELVRDREPVYRPVFFRVGERVTITLKGSMIRELTGMKLVAKDGRVVDEIDVGTNENEISVSGYLADRCGGYGVFLLDVGSAEWREAWSWTW